MLDLYLEHAFWFWLGLAAVILAVEVASGSGWLLWPAGAALVVAFLTLLIGPDPGAAIVAFAVLTLVSTLLARRYLPKSVLGQGGDINDNVGRLIGQEARAVAAFSDGSGRVLIDGKEWAAELAEGYVLAEGERVRVIGVADGSRLQVKPAG
jgi:membrane protein implicated in regulation of membrane protease activity